MKHHGCGAKGILPQSSAHYIECLLERCALTKDPSPASSLYSFMCRAGLASHPSLGNVLVCALIEAGSLRLAQNVFDMLAFKSDRSWNSFITRYIALGKPRRAFAMYKQMRQLFLFPSEFCYLGLLKSCIKLNDPDKGCEIRADIFSRGWLKTNTYLGNMLVDMYAKFGSLMEAQEIFDQLPRRNVVTWTTLIAGYTQSDQIDEALNLFDRMQAYGIFPNAHTYACILQCCGNVGAVDCGLQLHAEIARNMLLQTSDVLGCTLINMYGKCGLLAKAQEAFDALSSLDVATWSALISGYVQHGLGEEALKCLKQMKSEGFVPNSVTYSSCIKACGSIRSHTLGGELYAEISRKELFEKDHVLGSAIVDMYVKCGFLQKAQEVFDKLDVGDAVPWNTLIGGYLHHKHSEEALQCFEKMHSRNVSPDADTFVLALNACCDSKDLIKGKEIHAKISKTGFLEKNLAVGNALIALYATCGMLAKAEEIFYDLLAPDVVSWTALMSGFIEHDNSVDALRLFQQMVQESILPDVCIFTCCLKACGISGDVNLGKELHSKIQGNEHLQENLFLISALIDMYAKCGMLKEAQLVFDDSQFHDSVVWTALLTGYAQQGQTENVVCIFDRMRESGQIPTWVTFVSVLNACSHAGFVEKGVAYFEAMVNEYGITPNLEHYTCMIDLLGRAGQLEKAVQLIKKTSLHPDIELWLTVLGSCQKWGNVDLGRDAFEQVLLLDEKRISAYICMHNIFSQAGMHEDALKLEALRVNNLLLKRPERIQDGILDAMKVEALKILH